MDLASFFGILSGLALIFSAIFLNGNIEDFINVPGIMIVMGGTFAATFLTFPFKDVMSAFKAAFFVFARKKEDPNVMIATMVDLCNITRKKGLISLQNVKTRSIFLKRAAALISDSSDEETIRATLRIEIDSLKMRHYIVQEIFRKMAMYAPSFGMIGTLIGLIQMLSKLDDPSSIGPAMAVALLTTFYGSLLATMIFLPIAGKLKTRTVEQVVNLEIIFEGAVCILNANSPMMVYERLSSFIPNKSRRPMKFKDTGGGGGKGKRKGGGGSSGGMPSLGL
ncbi:MAG: motility protein A [Methylococcales bacterium]|jgi:chemotaxis protein MotA|nr:motility protein A [Methylococcales bacterium]MBT7409271.1 motility protein A [Methylococcales bacterium]